MIVTRFPPSPTGDLHLGSVRTALFSYLYARQQQGRFVLRIEDTDQERSSEASTRAILEGLAWIGLEFDEGPYFQSQRTEIYREYCERLLEKGLAYRCACSKERLESLREQQLEKKEKPKYDKHCLGHDIKEGPYCVRLNVPNEGRTVVEDTLHGSVVFENRELDDLIIWRSDDTPTYHFSVVIDDMLMGITHIIRGDDHLPNTPRQMRILMALDAPIPHYTHLPMILGDDGKRLSKRHGAVSVLQYKTLGYLPHALLNALVRLGWAHQDQEIFSKEEMIRLFDLQGLTKSPAALNVEKLRWLNAHYMMHLPWEELAPYLAEQLDRQGLAKEQRQNETLLQERYALIKKRAQTMQEAAEQLMRFYHIPETYEQSDVKKFCQGTDTIAMLEAAQDLLLGQTSIEAIDQALKVLAQRFALKFPLVAQPLRLAFLGTTQSAGIAEVICSFEDKERQERIEKFVQYLKENA